MAKCIGSRTDWRCNKIELEETSFLTDTAKIGENLLNFRLREIKSTTRDISRSYIKIKNSARYEDEHCDCYQVHDDLINNLDRLLSEVPSTIHYILKSDLMTVTKHRYFLHFSTGVIDKLKQMLMMIGRLNDLDQEIYLKEQHKFLISNESIVIHTLVEIWSASIELMNSFKAPAEELFKEQFHSEEYNFIKESEFYTSSLKYSKILLIDLTITAWLQFNRLVKYDDFLKTLTFLCPCNGKTFSKMLATVLNSNESEFLSKLLLAISEKYKDLYELSMMQTDNIRVMSEIPIIPCYQKIDDRNLAYFRIWFIYSLTRILKTPEDLKHLEKCEKILLSSFDIVMDQFKTTNSTSPSDFRLSPNQEEKFKLIFAMLDRWCECHKKSILVITRMFSYFDSNWNLYGDKYFDNTDYRINGLTLFQLFTKLVYEAIPIKVDSNGHATNSDSSSNVENNLTSEEKKLSAIWTKLLDRVTQKSRSQQPSAQSSVTTGSSGSSCNK